MMRQLMQRHRRVPSHGARAQHLPTQPHSLGEASQALTDLLERISGGSGGNGGASGARRRQTLDSNISTSLPDVISRVEQFIRSEMEHGSHGIDEDDTEHVARVINRGRVISYAPRRLLGLQPPQRTRMMPSQRRLDEHDDTAENENQTESEYGLQSTVTTSTSVAASMDINDRKTVVASGSGTVSRNDSCIIHPRLFGTLLKTLYLTVCILSQWV